MRNIVEIVKSDHNLFEIMRNCSEEDIKEGLNWYKEAYDFCVKASKKFKVDLDVCIQLIALFSPQTKWDRNKQILLNFLKFGDSLFVSRARIKQGLRIKQGEHLLDIVKGLKVRSFYHSIKDQGKGTVVCLDTHAINAHSGKIQRNNYKSKVWRNSKVYSELCDSYKKVAQDYKISPQECQAIIWTYWRKNKKVK